MGLGWLASCACRQTLKPSEHAYQGSDAYQHGEHPSGGAQEVFGSVVVAVPAIRTLDEAEEVAEALLSTQPGV